MEIEKLNIYKRLRDFNVPTSILDDIFSSEQDLGVLIIGFLSLSLQIWSQARAINKLHYDIEKMEVKVEAVRELLFRIGSG